MSPTHSRAKLLLMRHAKSDWADAQLSDHDRPLNERGIRDAPRMAVWLRDQNHLPDRILCSTAVRTRQTADLMISAWRAAGVPRDRLPAIGHQDSLYLATPDTILRNITSLGGRAECLMVIAHNPGISHLASLLTGHAMELSTAAIVCMQRDASTWDDVRDADDVALIETIRPKGL